MKTKQENRYSAHKSVKRFFDDHDALFSDADFTLARSLLTDQNTLMDALIQAQGLDRTGITIAKSTARQILEERSLILAGRIHAWAYLHQNPVLQAEMNFTKHGKTASTGIHRYADTELAPICRTIHQRATDNLASITTITAPELAIYMGFITTYENLLSAPTNAAAQSAAATSQIEPTLDRTDELLREVFDRLMLATSHSNPTLYAEYKENRKVIDLGTRHEEEEEPTPPAPPAPGP